MQICSIAPMKGRAAHEHCPMVMGIVQEDARLRLSPLSTVGHRMAEHFVRRIFRLGAILH